MSINLIIWYFYIKIFMQTPSTGGRFFSFIFFFFSFWLLSLSTRGRLEAKRGGGEKAELLGWQMGRGYGWLAEEDTREKKKEEKEGEKGRDLGELWRQEEVFFQEVEKQQAAEGKVELWGRQKYHLDSGTFSSLNLSFHSTLV